MFYCQIFKGSSSRDKIEDSYYSFLKTPIGVENVLSTSETARFLKVEVLETRLKTLIARKSAVNVLITDNSTIKTN